MWKVLAMVVVVAALAVAAVLTLLWFEHTRPVILPAPSGPFPVGRVDYDWIDHSRVDPVAAAAGTPRELTVWIWYPAARQPQSTTVEYEPAPLRMALDRHVGPIMRNLLTHDLSRVQGHAARGAQVSPAKRRYPIVLFKPGIGALALDYTTLAEDLASHGYVVVASDSPHSTAVVVYRDGRIVTRTAAGHPTDVPMADAHRLRAVAALAKIWAADERFLLDHLQRINSEPDSSPAASTCSRSARSVIRSAARLRTSSAPKMFDAKRESMSTADSSTTQAASRNHFSFF